MDLDFEIVLEGKNLHLAVEEMWYSLALSILCILWLEVQSD